MITVVDERLRREATELGLRFTCEHCAHFDEALDACGNGYPTVPHLRIELAQIQKLEFCKEFELA